MTRRFTTGLTALALVATAACGKSEEQKQAEEAAQKIAEATKAGADQMAAGAAAVAKGLEAMTKGVADAAGTVDVLPFEKLGEAMPDVSGWKRGEVRGRSTTMPFSISTSEARYENGDARVDVEITDTALNQVIMAPFSMYLVQNYSERSSDGYRKGTTFKGEPAFEEVENRAKRGSLTVVVGKRFIVKASGRNVADAEPARSILDKMDFSKLTAAK